MLSEKRPEIKAAGVRGAEYRDDYGDRAFQTFHMPDRFIGETLNDEIGCWEANIPVLIEAQTGSGKTSFIMEKIIPKAVRENRNVIMLVNRVAITSQQKRRWMELSDDPRKDDFTETGLQKVSLFGNVAILTYHSLNSFLKDHSNQAWLQRVEYAICDEIHFLAADALFNAYTYYALYQVTRTFSHAVRIYLTATAWDIAYLLSELEKRMYPPLIDCVMGTASALNPVRYVYETDYSHYNIEFFDKLEDLKGPIEQSPDEKWLIFCDSKDKGKKFINETLGEGRALYLDRDSKEDAAWAQLVVNESFSKQCLITTAVLDCGANIHDPKVRHIAVCADNRTAMMQMVGRKRMDGDETVTVHVMNLDRKSISFRKQQLLKQLKLINEYSSANLEQRQKMMDRMWDELDTTTMRMFSTHKGDLHLNDAAEFVVTKQLMLYDQFLSEDQAFHDAVLRWFGKPVAPKEPLKYNSLEDFYNQYKEEWFDEAVFSDLRALILQCYRKAGLPGQRADRDDDVKCGALNNRLDAMKAQYKIIKSQDGWQLVKRE